MARAKRIYILIIKVNKLISFYSSRCLLEEIENMYSVFLSSYRNTRESLGELEKAVETLPCSSCSHSISRSPKLPLVFLWLDRNTAHDFYFLNVNCNATTEQLSFYIRFSWHSPTQIFRKSNPKNVRSVLVCMQVGYVIMKRTFNYSLGTTMEKENLKYSDFAFGTNFLIYQRIYHFTLHLKYIWNNSYLYCGCRRSEEWSSQ